MTNQSILARTKELRATGLSFQEALAIARAEAESE